VNTLNNESLIATDVSVITFLPESYIFSRAVLMELQHSRRLDPAQT